MEKKGVTLIVMVIILFLSATLLLSSCAKNESGINSQSKKKISIVKFRDSSGNLASYFGDFSVVDNNVFFSANLRIKNPFPEKRKVIIRAESEEDVKGGLLKDKKMVVVDGDNKPLVLELKPNSTEDFDVRFLGEYAGKMIKQDRLLPDKIIIEVIK